MAKAQELEGAADSDARLRLALAFGDLAIWELDVPHNHLTRSPELNRLYGFPPDATPQIADYLGRYAPGELERVTRLSEEAGARGDTKINIEIKHIWPDGTVKWLLVRAEAVDPEPGKPTFGGHVLGIVIDITQRKLIELALVESERRLRLSQQAGGIASFELDVATGMLFASDNFWALWGLPQRSSIHIDELQALIVPDFRVVVSSDQTRRAGTSEPRIELQIRRADTGEVRWLARDLEFQRDAAGNPVKMFGVMRDITTSKAATERQALLTHELQHRIKNILATVSAIASQTLRSGDLESARETFTTRLKALAEAHNILTGTGWTEASLRQVLDAALAPHNLGARAALRGVDRKLTPRMALSMALAVNELATNAVKYGALSNDAGRVDISWDINIPPSNEPELVWIWRESGGPRVDAPQRRGFGSVLIERVLGADFGGTVTTDYASKGIVTTLKAPMANLPRMGLD